MRGLVRNADAILLFGLRMLCWYCCAMEVSAGGGALDTGQSNFPTRSSSSGASMAASTTVPPPVPSPVKMTAFSGSYTDGLAKAVARDAAQSSVETCNDDLACITMASHDRLGLEAIESLHSQLDDDADGDVDLSESDDFLREELQYEAGYERRQRAFHHNDDMHISVRELWEAWLRSEVHNWTIEQTSEWLTSNVELPQYVSNFIQHRVTGATLPRLAVNNMHYLSNVLGIKDPIHKQKIALKAMDVVLFGPPKDTGHSLKDLVLITLLFGALIACWYAYQQKKRSEKHVRRLVKDMEGLHNAEVALEDLQKELERARLEQESAATEKENLVKRLQDESLGLHASCSDLEVSQLKAEIEMLKMELQRAEGELEDRCWSPPVGLQHWLQLTHEIENKAYTKKRISAEKQLQQAREACEKLRKKRSSLVGAFVSTHGKSIDEVDRSIVEARTSLNEVTVELQERVHRWKQIELLCGFNIINNNGLNYLETILYRGAPNGRSFALRGRMSSSQDDLDDDSSSLYSPSTSGGGGGGGGGGGAAANIIATSTPAAGGSEQIFGWKESSVPPDSASSSETGKETPPERIKFIVGGGDETSEQATPNENKTWRREAASFGSVGGSRARGMVRSCSQDANALASEERAAFTSGGGGGGGGGGSSSSSFLSKTCSSENSLGDIAERASSRFASLRKQPTFREPPPSVQQSIDDETLSTDSNSTADNDEMKRRRRRKLHFPAFRKTKTKPT